MILPYCIAAAPCPTTTVPAGIQQAEVTRMSEGPLCCFYSAHQDLASATADDAVIFHKVVMAVFDKNAIIPFRFPNLLSSEDDLRQFLRKHESEYVNFLKKVDEAVQMELRFAPSANPATGAALPPSGSAYLQGRRARAVALQAAADSLREKIAQLALEWDQHAESRSAGDSLHCFVQVKRAEIQEFNARVGSFSPGEAIKMTVTGPWPAAHFLKAESE